MREADLLTSGARGVNAPEATARDAVRIVLAMMLDTSLASVAADVKLFGSLKPVNAEKFSDAFAPTTLEDAMVVIVEEFMRRSADDVKTFTASVRLVPYIITATVKIGDIWDARDGERGDEFGIMEKTKSIEFCHPAVDDITEADLAPVYHRDSARFPRRFWQAPELHANELAMIGAIVSGKIAF